MSSISVIDTATRAVVATVLVGFEPAAVAILPDGSRAYVANAGDGTVSVIDTATRAVVGSAIRVEDNPQGIAVSPDSARVYVTNFSSHSVSVIETASNTVVGTIQVGFFPYGIAVTPDGRRLYVVDNGSVAVIDAATQTLTTRVTLPPFHTSRRVAVSADGTRVYVTINTPPITAHGRYRDQHRRRGGDSDYRHSGRDCPSAVCVERRAVRRVPRRRAPACDAQYALLCR